MTTAHTRRSNTPLFLGLGIAFGLILAFEALSFYGDIRFFEGDQLTRFVDNGTRYEVRMDGPVEFLEDESGVASLGKGASFEIQERQPGYRRKLVVTADAQGAPVYEQTIDRKPVEFDAESREWLASMLRRLHRQGFDASGRVARLVDHGGADAVFAEIDDLGSEYLKRRYLTLLLERVELDPAETVGLLEVAARELDSDYDLGEMLIALGDLPLDDDDVRRAWLAATATLDSDYELRRAVTPRVERGAADATLTAVLEAAAELESDYDRAELLIAIVRASPDDEPLPADFFASLEALGGGYEMRRVLGQILEIRSLEIRPVDRADVEAMLDAAARIEASHELGSFLEALAEKYPIVREMRPRVEQLLDGMDSEYEREQTRLRLGMADGEATKGLS